MIRFRCSQCGKSIKVTEERAGSAVRCPRCRERVVVPAGDSAAAAGRAGSDWESSETEAAGRQVASARTQARALFPGMSGWPGRAAALLAAVGLVSLLLPVVAPLWPGGGALAAWATPWAMVLVPSCLALLLLILHGQATGCPSCGKWWVRTRDETQFVGREVFNKGGVPFARATYRTTYTCGACRHRWSAEHTDEYKDFIRPKPPKRQRLD